MGTKFSSRDIKITIKNKTLNRTIENLHIKATIIKTLAGSPNTAILEIYNLNTASRDTLSKNVYDFKDDIGITTVTFELDDNVLFTGDLININHVPENNKSEFLSTLYCGDGFNAYRTKSKNKFDKGTTRKEMIDTLIEDLESDGVAVKGFISQLKACTNKSVLKTIITDGEIIGNIKKLLKDCLGGTTDNEDVFIEDGKINILNKKDVIKNYKVILNSDLLEPPVLNEQGVNAKIKLNSLLKTGAEIEIKTRGFNAAFGNLTINRVQKTRIDGTGTYKITDLKHIVDNFSDEVATTEVTGVITGLIQ